MTRLTRLLSLLLAATLLCLSATAALAEDKTEEQAAEEIAALDLTALIDTNMSYDYTETDIQVQAEGYLIPATLTVPTGEAGQLFPAVVMCHGNGSNRQEAGNGYDIAAPILAMAGIASIRFDYIGNGDSQEPYTNFTYDTGVSDALTCYAHLSTLGVIDMKRVGIMGWSQGGGIALMAAGRSGDFVSVVTWAGACYDGQINQEHYEIAKKDGYYEQTYDWREPLRQSPAYYECAMNTHVLEDVKKYNGPILAINGAEDTVVLPATAEKIVSASSNEDSDVYIIEGADHTFNIFTGNMSAFDELVMATTLFFLSTL